MHRLLRAPRDLALVVAVLAASTSGQQRLQPAGGTPPVPVGFRQQVCFTDDVALQTTAWADSVTLPLFDPCEHRGVLVGVSVTLDAHTEGSAAAENLGTAPSTVTLEWSARLEVQRPDTSVLVFAEPSLTFVESLEAFDGTLDFAGPSGRTFPDLSADVQATHTAPPPASDLALFTGPGTIVLPVLASGTSFASGPGNLVAQFSQAASAVVTVCYDYVADCDCDGLSDADELAMGAPDCNANGIPDECEPDCDGDGVPDECDPGSCEPTDLACEEFDRFADLTPNDTLTVIASQHNPQQEQGYLWVYAVNAAGQGIAADSLVGQELVVDGLEALEYAVNAVDYRAAVSAGALTDVDADGVRDLDGIEYEKTAGEILVPRFLGSDPTRQTRGELVLVGLSGGSQFTTTVDFLVYNDDEDAFSANYTFYCWDKVHTLEVSNLFSNHWLKNFSGQNPAKGLGQIEYGWFRVNGDTASSDFFSLLDPALYAVYVEKIGGTAAADLPFEQCTQSGHLLPRLVTGDNSETSGAPSDEDCGERRSRRHPASLLLYPEFDSRSGIATVITVTNASETDDVRAHFVYVGRYGN